MIILIYKRDGPLLLSFYERYTYEYLSSMIGKFRAVQKTLPPPIMAPPVRNDGSRFID